MTNQTEQFNHELKNNYFKVDPRLIDADEDFNIRKDYGDLEMVQLKESIKTNGVRVPMRGSRNGDRFILTDGFRRYKATMELLAQGVEIARVPFMLEEKHYTNEQRILDMFILNDGKRLTPLEEGELFAKLETFGWTRKEIGRKTGRDQVYISNMLNVARQSAPVKEAIAEGKIAATTVVKISRAAKGDTAKVSAMVDDAVNEAKRTGRTKATAAATIDKKATTTHTYDTLAQMVGYNTFDEMDNMLPAMFRNHFNAMCTLAMLEPAYKKA